MSRHRRFSLLFFATAAFVPAISTFANVALDSPEFQVNTYTTLFQVRPAVAAGHSGDFVVTWASYGSGDTDSSYYSIQAQRYSSDGTPQGGEFQVNTYTSSFQFDPAIAFGPGPGGGFVVVWSSFGSASDPLYSIHGQRFDSAATPLGGEFQVNSYTSAAQARPDVGVGSLGSFVVTWSSQGSSGDDSSGYSVQAQAFNANGTPVGGEIQVNSYTSGYQYRSTLAMGPMNSFVVVWSSYGSADTDSSFESIQVRRFAFDGTPFGSEMQVNSYTTSVQRSPALAVDQDGDFVVSWSSYGSSEESSMYSVQAQRFASNGTRSGGELQVNAYTSLSQLQPAVAVGADGDFVVAWSSNGSTGTDSSFYSIQARHFAANGTPRGGELQVNSYTSLGQYRPAVTVDPMGNFVVVWHGYGSTGNDSSYLTVQGRRLIIPPIFAGGFESGDTSAWSATAP